MSEHKPEAKPSDFDELREDLQKLRDAAQRVCDEARALCEQLYSIRYKSGDVE